MRKTSGAAPKINWPTPQESLRREVARYRDVDVAGRLQVLDQLYEHIRELKASPQRRQRIEAGREQLVRERRAAFATIIVRAQPVA